MQTKAMDLYEAYVQSKLPKDEGYVVSAFFLADTPYSIFEVVSYTEVKNFYTSGDGITFQSNGKKIYVLVEPTTYTQKSVEPYVRPSKYQIPLRFADLNTYVAKNQYRIMYNKEPVSVMSSFTVLKSKGMNFSFILYQQPEIKQTLGKLFEKAFNGQCNIPLSDAKKVSDQIASLITTKMVWLNKKSETADAAVKNNTDEKSAPAKSKKRAPCKPKAQKR